MSFTPLCPRTRHHLRSRLDFTFSQTSFEKNHLLFSRMSSGLMYVMFRVVLSGYPSLTSKPMICTKKCHLCYLTGSIIALRSGADSINHAGTLCLEANLISSLWPIPKQRPGTESAIRYQSQKTVTNPHSKQGGQMGGQLPALASFLPSLQSR